MIEHDSVGDLEKMRLGGFGNWCLDPVVVQAECVRAWDLVTERQIAADEAARQERERRRQEELGRAAQEAEERQRLREFVRQDVQRIADDKNRQRQRNIEIYEARARGDVCREIAQRHGISIARVQQICLRFDEVKRRSLRRLHLRAHLARPIEIDAAGDRDRWHEFVLGS